MKLFKKILTPVLSIIMIILLCSCNVTDIPLDEEKLGNIISQIQDEVEENLTQGDNDINIRIRKKRPGVSNSSSSDKTQSEESFSDYPEYEYTPDEDYNDTYNESYYVPRQDFRIRKITSVQDLQEFAHAVNTGYNYEGEQITLEADIDLSGMEWTPIGSYNYPFKGTFSGKGHVISNLTITEITDEMIDSYGENIYVGLFGYAQDAVITGIVLENVNINVNNDTNANYMNVGSVVGYMMARNTGVTLTKCKASGSINVSADDGKITLAGGIVGGFDANHKNTYCNMQWVESSVNITAEGFVSNLGGIAGTINSQDSDSHLTDMVYIGTINDEKVKRSYVGGICGVFNSHYKISLKNLFSKLTLNRIGNNSYSELAPCQGIIIGDECAGTAALGLENVYGCVILKGENKQMPMVGRASNTVNYKNCIQTDKIPDNAVANFTNWNLTDRSSPTIKIEKH